MELPDFSTTTELRRQVETFQMTPSFSNLFNFSLIHIFKAFGILGGFAIGLLSLLITIVHFSLHIPCPSNKSRLFLTKLFSFDLDINVFN